MSTLDKRLASWKDILSLTDWNITIEETEPPFMLDNAAATISFEAEHMMAHINIRKGSEEVDHSIVHELLHIWLNCWDVTGELVNSIKEQAINAIARGVVDLYGRINRKPDSQYSVGSTVDGATGRGGSKRRSGVSGKTRPGTAKPRN